MRRTLLLAAGLIPLLCLSLSPLSPAAAETTVPTCFGMAATIVGTDGPDGVGGTPGDDVIVTLGGDDAVTSGPGSDRICTGGGNDEVFAGLQSDTSDYIDGGSGNDELGGADVTVQVCPNTIFGSDLDGRNVIYGGAGDDYIVGGNGGDRIFGEQGNDCVLSEGGNDHVSVGKGADYAEGEVGDDVLIGGPGADTLNDSVTSGDTDSLRGAGGNDHLDVVDNDTLDTADGGPKDDSCGIDNPAPAELDTAVNCETIVN